MWIDKVSKFINYQLKLIVYLQIFYNVRSVKNKKNPVNSSEETDKIITDLFLLH